MKRVQVLGPFHSGTNLLLNMITNNCMDINRPEDPVDVSENMFAWKHTLRELHLNEVAIESPDNVFIIIYKNVYNWIFSIALQPIDIKLEEGLLGKCSMLTHECKNIIELYNKYYNMYKRLLETYPNNFVMIDYYKFIQGETTIDYIRPKLEKIGLKLKDEKLVLEKLNKPSKQNNSVQNSKEALDKYFLVQKTMKKVLVSYPHMMSSLDTELMDYFGSL